MAPQSPALAPIGVFDSGVGGLSVLRQMRERMPHESFIYIADSRFAPYGEKSHAFIRERSLDLTRFLVEQGAKLIVVACNTATAAAVTTLRDVFTLPIVAMEPAVKPAVQLSRSGSIGVLATTGTLSSARFAALLDRFGSDASVHTQSCTGWVELVEQGQWDSGLALEQVRQHVEPLLAQSVDTLILGCTHYPFLKPLISQVAGPDVAIVDTGEAVARRVQQVLGERGLQRESGAAEYRFYSSQELVAAQRVIETLWGVPVLGVLPLPQSLDQVREPA